MTICTKTQQTIINASRQNFVSSLINNNVCVDSQRTTFGVKSPKVCIEPGSIQPQVRFKRDTFSPEVGFTTIITGQVMFVLSQTAKNPSESFFFTVNGQTQRYTLDYTVSGNILIFVDDNWSLESGDTAMMVYNF